jgi:glycosyltransferase involved in cell wall biosynthesis
MTEAPAAALKVALVVPGFSAHERDWCIPALLDYVRALAQRAEVCVYTLRWPERRARYAVHGAEVWALGGGRGLGARAPRLWADAVRAMAAEHRRAPFDLVHAFWADEPGWVAVLAGALLGRPVLVSLAGGELIGLPDIGYGLRLLPGRRRLVRWILDRASAVSAGSDYLLGLGRDEMPPGQWGKLHRAPLGVDTTLFRPPARAAPRSGVITAAALTPVKDHARLLRVLARVPGASASLAGDGPLRGHLEALASDLGLGERVRMLGAVDHAALPALYAGARVYAQTSRHEAQGMALLEAAACGVPALGTAVGALPEVGAAAADDDALAAGLDALLRDPAQASAAGEAARARVEAEFSLEAAGARFARLYATLISSSYRRSAYRRDAPGGSRHSDPAPGDSTGGPPPTARSARGPGRG